MAIKKEDIEKIKSPTPNRSWADSKNALLKCRACSTE
jgi:hypothetical protein